MRWIAVISASLRVRSSFNYINSKVIIFIVWLICKIHIVCHCLIYYQEVCRVLRISKHRFTFYTMSNRINVMFRDYSLIYIIWFWRCAGELKKSEPEEDEHYIISKALQTVKYCELLPQDQKMFRQILDRVAIKSFENS